MESNATDTNQTTTIDDPIDLLTREHDEGLAELSQIAAAAKSIQVDGFSAKAFQDIATAVRSISAVNLRHAEKEEQYLFPLLERHISGMPGSLIIEHREVNRAFQELVRSVNDVEEGRIHGSSIRELLQLANFVVSHLSSHITRENTVLFPMVRRLLTDEEYGKLKQEIALAASRPA